MAADRFAIIDPHLHLFDLQLGQYRWLRADNPPMWPDKFKIARNFDESDLQLPKGWQLKGFVHIEAGFDNQQPWREIDWLETNCQLPFKSVACADLCSSDFTLQVTHLKQRRSVVGIRHILDEESLAILNHPLCQPHFALLAQLGWRFDAQLAISDSAAVHALLKLSRQFPEVAIIINHAGWPPAVNDTEQFKRWSDNLQALSEHPNVAIKMSGWEMPNHGWMPSDMLVILQHSIAVMGTERVMLASNFPLCNFSHSYASLWRLYRDKLLNELLIPHAVWRQLSADNAAKWYQLD